MYKCLKINLMINNLLNDLFKIYKKKHNSFKSNKDILSKEKLRPYWSYWLVTIKEIIKKIF